MRGLHDEALDEGFIMDNRGANIFLKEEISRCSTASVHSSVSKPACPLMLSSSSLFTSHKLLFSALSAWLVP